MSYRVLITPRTFGKIDPLPLTLLQEAGYELVFNPLERPLTEEEIIPLIKEADGVIVGLDPINEEVLNHATRLKVISKYGAGVNNINLQAAADRGIIVTNTPGVNSSAVAELAIGLMLDVVRQISASDRLIRRGGWGRYLGYELKGKVLGIIGAGSIGKQLALKTRGFEMPLIVYDIKPDYEWAEKIGASYVSLTELFKKADMISVHLPLSDVTYHLIGQEELNLIKKTGIIINTSRGGIIDENALYMALKEKRLFGAGLDVYEDEPLGGSLLKTLDNVVLTSHIGAHTQEAVGRMGREAVLNLIAVLDGKTPDYIAREDINSA